jgi:NAD(P)-dependent dehydrogenase (short-subunit alcohol dehydrogenase family)
MPQGDARLFGSICSEPSKQQEANLQNTKEKVYILTGATAESRRTQARDFIRSGAAVVLTDPDFDACRVLAGALGPRAAFACGDVGTEQGWLEVFQTAVNLFGRVDGVIDNGSIYDPDLSGNYDPGLSGNP